MQKKTEVVQVRMSEKMRLKLKKYCERSGCKEAEVIRERLKKFLR